MRIPDPYRFSREELIENLESNDPLVVAQAAHELGRRAKRDGVALRLRALLADNSPLVRTAAAEALGKLGARSAIPVLIEMLANRRERNGVRETAAYALGLFRDRRALDVLQVVAAETATHDEFGTLHRCAAGAAMAIAAQLAGIEKIEGVEPA